MPHDTKYPKEVEKMSTRKTFLMTGFLLFGFVVGCVTANLSGAQDKFPTKPITCIVGYGPGGAADLPVRALAEVASKVLGQPVVVLNKPGAGSAVALGELKNAQPDGYTIGLLSTGAIISPHLRKVTYHPVDDFDAVLQFCVGQYGLAARADSPYNSLKDLIAYAAANPNKVKYSTAGAGTPQHLVMLLLGDAAKVKWTNIPFGSGNEAVAALLGGHVDCVSQSGEWKPHVLAGRLRLLATYGDKRTESFPNVPTLVEMGYRITCPAIACLVGPKGISTDRLKILHDALYKGLEDPGFKKSLDATDQLLVYKNSHDTQLFIKELYESTGKIIEENREAMKN
jgi:tripartite-type tricarboxylate transporter receptor subunit TctC